MNPILSGREITSDALPLVGGKGHALAALMNAGFRVPDFFCVTTEAYNDHIDRTGLRERIFLELNRKDFSEMRWEEIWDCATRIRHMFLRKPPAFPLTDLLRSAVLDGFQNRPVVVRSSAPEEDDVRFSFAGLHESYVNVCGVGSIIEHIQKVWASLWSDAALLYRRELGLDAATSSMAVVVQEMVSGEKSGIVFSQSPNDPSQAVIESVYGLNQGLVDGTVEPDRWIIDRDYLRVIAHSPAGQRLRLMSMGAETAVAPVRPDEADRPPLNGDEVDSVCRLARRAETHFGAPQDVEWTFRGGDLYLLQSRPVTTRPAASPDDQRTWYLSLHRSFQNLKSLRQKIEGELIPGMIRSAEELSAVDLGTMTEGELAAEIRRRWKINTDWSNVYWADFIPFAHGIRLFGQVYNDTVKPENPYEFLDLLTRSDLASLERNRMLENLAQQVRNNTMLADCLRRGDCGQKAPDFRLALERFVEKFGDLSCTVTGGTQCEGATRPLTKILIEMSSHQRPPMNPTMQGKFGRLSPDRFLNAFPDEKRQDAAELLDLARASYRLRDDDNIHIGRIESHLLAAIQEGRRRLASGRERTEGSEHLKTVLEEVNFDSKAKSTSKIGGSKEKSTVKPRQIVGQPAGPGIARGNARVIHRHTDLADFVQGEVLVCDAVDPNMTFVAPLAAAVIERRGGMLIHGAIIAREYGLPCVTGLADLTSVVHTGDLLTVDGYLGIVTVGSGELPAK